MVRRPIPVVAPDEACFWEGKGGNLATTPPHWRCSPTLNRRSPIFYRIKAVALIRSKHGNGSKGEPLGAPLGAQGLVRP